MNKIQFGAGDKPDVTSEKLRRLADQVEQLANKPPAALSAPDGFGRVKRIYVDPATDELVVVTDNGVERRYAAVP